LLKRASTRVEMLFAALENDIRSNPRATGSLFPDSFSQLLHRK